MGLLTKRRGKTQVDRRQSLAGVPIIYDSVTVEERTPETLTLKIQQTRGEGIIQRFRPAVSTKAFKLDEFGSFVVKQIDNERTVGDIIKNFSQHFGLSYRESEMGVAAFIKMLMKRHIIAVGMQK